MSRCLTWYRPSESHVNQCSLQVATEWHIHERNEQEPEEHVKPHETILLPDYASFKLAFTWPVFKYLVIQCKKDQVISVPSSSVMRTKNGLCMQLLTVNLSVTQAKKLNYLHNRTRRNRSERWWNNMKQNGAQHNRLRTIKQHAECNISTKCLTCTTSKIIPRYSQDIIKISPYPQDMV